LTGYASSPTTRSHSTFDPDNILLYLLHVDQNATVSAALKFSQKLVKASAARHHLSLSSLIWETDERDAIRYHRPDMDVRAQQISEADRHASFAHALKLLSLAFPGKEDEFAQRQKLRPKAHQLLIYVDARRAAGELRPELGLKMVKLLDRPSL